MLVKRCGHRGHFFSTFCLLFLAPLYTDITDARFVAAFRAAVETQRLWKPRHDLLIRSRAMDDVSHLFENNRRWVGQMAARDPGFFHKLSRQQTPKYLWIGCADSRVPANEIVGLLPGELFVHRNVSNVVAAGDVNCLAVIHYAVDVLRVRHIIVCGHFGCGGVQAALEDESLGLIDQWLRHVRDVRDKHQEQLSALKKVLRSNRLAELNVIEQALNVAQTASCVTPGHGSRDSPSTGGFTPSTMACCGIWASPSRAQGKRHTGTTRRSGMLPRPMCTGT